MNKLTEETKRAKMKECTFTPKLIRKYVPPATGDERSVSAPMTRPSTSVFDKVTGNFKRKVDTHVGARLYKQATEIAKRKENQRIKKDHEYSFTPKIIKPLYRKVETAVVSSSLQLNSLKSLVTPTRNRPN